MKALLWLLTFLCTSQEGIGKYKDGYKIKTLREWVVPALLSPKTDLIWGHFEFGVNISISSYFI